MTWTIWINFPIKIFCKLFLALDCWFFSLEMHYIMCIFNSNWWTQCWVDTVQLFEGRSSHRPFLQIPRPQAKSLPFCPASQTPNSSYGTRQHLRPPSRGTRQLLVCGRTPSGCLHAFILSGLSTERFCVYIHIHVTICIMHRAQFRFNDFTYIQ